jgi:hypothetical protein
MICRMPEKPTKPAPPTKDRFPEYDVLSKRLTPSWNETTREVIAQRLAIGGKPKFFTAEEFRMVGAIAARIVPQPPGRPPIPVAALVDEKLHRGQGDGYRQAGMPRDEAAWRQGLRALQVEAAAAFGKPFRELSETEQDALLARMQKGKLKARSWGRMRPEVFFRMRMARDLVLAYYAHPSAWSQIGWGGPASPRGYVRMDYDERDPWEAAEVKDGDVETARRKNRHVGSL